MSILRRWNGSAWEDVTNNLTNAPTAGGAAYGSGSAVAFTAAGTSGQVLTSGGSGAPTWGDNGSPTGAITMFGSATPPTGWLVCDGSSLLRAGTYAALFAVIGTLYGTVDGTHFNLPDFASIYPRGNTPGQTKTGATGAASGGAATHTLTAAEMPTHTHIQDAHGHVNNTNPTAGGTAVRYAGSAGGAATSISVLGTTAVNQDTGGGGAHNNLPPYIGVCFIIKI